MRWYKTDAQLEAEDDAVAATIEPRDAHEHALLEHGNMRRRVWRVYLIAVGVGAILVECAFTVVREYVIWTR